MYVLIEVKEYYEKTVARWAKDRNMTFEKYCELHLNQSIDETIPR